MGSMEDGHHSSLLESLPARPPTPPRETLSHDLDLLPKQLIAPQQLAHHLRSLQTPPGVSSPTTSSSNSTARRKRVGFSSQAQYQDAPIYTDPSSRRQQPTPVSLPSSTSRPVKGILKPAVAPNRLGPANGVSLDIEKPGQINIADMLESTLQQLAGADRESKVDAYTMLFRGLKASSNLPDRIALQEKTGIFMQFIQRDLISRTSTGMVDTLLVTSALKLLHTFLRFQGIASSIPSEFGTFFVDHCVRSFEDEQVPKEVIRHLMQALFFQNFPPEVMTFDRMGRLINALHDIENHMTGKSIIQSRIHVYEKFVNQCPQQMTVHSDWLQDLFTDMLSSAAEIRAAATILGLNAAFTLNKDKRLVSRALDLLNLSLEDKKYVEHITERLKAMLKDEGDCVSVPRIWSVITLFIPSPDQWDYFKSWSSIIQQSFNHSNPHTRKEANLAWSRFTYRLFLDRRLDHKPVVTLIGTPLHIQLKRKGLRDSVLGGTRNFFYYALRPDMNLRMLNEIWDFGVKPLMQGLINHKQEDNANTTQAAAILTGLIDCKTRRLWSGDRITDAAVIKDDELPAVESKWIRANPSRIFALVAPILQQGFSELSVPASYSSKLWRALVHSVASASAKDVKLHDDTAKFVARAFTFLLSTWMSGPTSLVGGRPCSSSQFLDSVREFVLILVQGLGLLPNPFMDKQFTRTEKEQFVLQTARPGKSQASKRLPLHHLFLFLSHLPPGVLDDDTFAHFFKSTFAPFFDEKSEKAQADLAQELLHLLPIDAYCPYGPWVICSEKISATLGQSQYSHLGSSSGSGSNLGPEFRELVRTLERGLRSTPNLPWPLWAQLFQSICSRIRNDIGDAGVAIVVVEQLTNILKDLVIDEKVDVIPSNWVDATIELVAAAAHPRDKQAVDVARRRLWGTSNAGARGSSFDPFDSLYKLIVIMLQSLYANIGSYASDNIAQLMSEVSGLFDRGNSLLSLRAMIAIQDGLVCWLRDEDHRVTRPDFSGVVEVMRSLWQGLCKILVGTSEIRCQLNTVEPLFCAAFRSTHRDIVGIAAETWNQIYENVDHIEYSETLKTVLASLGSSVDITRPGLELRDEESDNFRSNFIESQEDSISLPIVSPARLQPTPQPRPVSRRSATPGPANVAETSRAQNGTTISQGKPKGRTPRPRPRHEDSQMQFSAIEFPPALVSQDSQLLTDRQKEIRERQRENAVMFPEIRSSPTEKIKKARSTNAQQPQSSSSPKRASTPEQDGSFDDCLTSTPTPRRGKPVSLTEQDQEMTDPPSSPPEPRGYRLLAELKSQSNKTNSLDNWQFSSSPISGSPNLAHQTVSVSQPIELDDVDEDLRLDDEGNVAENNDYSEAELRDVTSEFEVVEETTMLGQEEILPVAAAEIAASQPSPTTPTGRKSQSSVVQLTPRSDNDEFVDAPTSPLPPTPSQRVTRRSSQSSGMRQSPRRTANSQSFNVSASFETGLRDVGTSWIEIPLRSTQPNSPRMKEFKSYTDIFPESPDQALCQQNAQQFQQPRQDEATTEALDSIEVAGAEAKHPRRGRSKKTRRASASQDLQPPQTSEAPLLSLNVNEIAASEFQENYEDVSPGSGRWWRKRKRSVSSVHSSGGSKKARHGALLAESILEEVPDSQTAAAASGEGPLEVQTAEELYQNDVSVLSIGNNSPAERTAASEASSFAIEESVEKSQVEPVTEFGATEQHAEEMADFTDEEEAIHSQLVREEKQASAERESRLASHAVSPVRHMSEQVASPLRQAEHVNTLCGAFSPVQEHAEPEPSKYDSLMVMLRSGLDTLRSVDLTREQYYQAEDLFFEMKRELLDAERRGRE